MAKTKTPPAPVVTETKDEQETEQDPIGQDGSGTEGELSNEPAATADTVDADSRIVPHKSGAVATLEDVGELMEADAQEGGGHGFEKGDVAIPFFRVLQANSPQAKRQNPAYVDGAVEGSFFNTVTSQVYDGENGVDFLPIAFRRQATLWWPRVDAPSGKKGFVTELPIPEAELLLKTNTEKNDKGKDVVKEGPHAGQELVFAAMYYGFVLGDNGSFEPVAFPLTFTQIKKARMWNALIQGARLPNSSGVGTYNPKMSGFVYHLTTVPESNDKGSWMGVKIVRSSPLLEYRQGKPTEVYPCGAQLYLAARDFEALFATGRVKVKQDDMNDDGGGAAATDEEDGAKLPF
jgi:hypothetical protein